MTVQTTNRSPVVAYTLIEASAAETAGWDTLVDRFDSRSLFHRTAWLHYLADSRRLDIRQWAIRDGHDTVGYLSGGLLRMGPFRILGSPLRSWGTNVMGPLVNGNVDQTRFLAALDGLAARERLSMIEIENPLLSADLLRRAGFQLVSDLTYMVKLLPDEGSMWRSLESECRNRIRKAQQAGVRVEDTDDPAVAEEYYDFYLRLMHRKGRRAPFDLRTVRLLVEHLKKADNLFALRAHDASGALIAVGLFPHDDETMYFWSGASDETAHDLCPNDLLHWTAMRRAAQRGLHAYNMSGYGRFKRKFGGELVELARWHKCYSRSARWARAAYRYSFDRWSTIDARRHPRPANGSQSRTSLPMPVLRQRAVKRLSDVARAPLHDFPIRDEVLFQYLPLAPSMDLLEVGPGSGYTAFHLSRQVGSVTLADIAEGNVRTLERALGHIPNLRFASADVCRPGLRDHLGTTYDAVYAIEVFELLPDPRTCLINLAAVTRPGGHVLIQFPNYPPGQSPGPTHFTTKAELGRLLQEAGFSRWNISAIRLRPHASFIYRYLHEKPIQAYRRRRAGRGPERALVYDESWAFRHGDRLQPFKYALHAAWVGMSAAIRTGGAAFEHWDPGPRILNHNLIVLAQR